MSDLSGKDISGRLVDTVIESSVPLPMSDLVAYFKGARIALRFMQGVADDRWVEMADAIGDALDRLPGGDNPGHRR